MNQQYRAVIMKANEQPVAFRQREQHRAAESMASLVASIG